MTQSEVIEVLPVYKAVNAALTTSDGMLILTQRPYDESHGGAGEWFITSGGVEEDEEWGEAALREVTEETGLTDEVGGVLTIAKQTIRHEINGNAALYEVGIYHLPLQCASTDLDTEKMIQASNGQIIGVRFVPINGILAYIEDPENNIADLSKTRNIFRAIAAYLEQ